MASLEEFVSAVQSSIESLKQAQSSMDAPKQQAEELSSQFQGLGAESMATGASGLKDGVEQTQNAVPPIISQLEQIISSAQGMKSGLRAPAPDVRPPPTPLDAAPPALREPVAKVGDPMTAPDSGPGPYRQELDSSDEDDKGMSKFRRAARRTSRNAESLQEQAKDSFSVRLNAPEDYETHTSVASPHEPVIRGVSDQPDPQDIVGTSVILVATAVEGFSRLWDRWRSRSS